MTEVLMIYTGIISFWQDPKDGSVWLFAPVTTLSDHPHVGWVLTKCSQLCEASDTCEEIDLDGTTAENVKAFKIFNWIEPQLDREEGVTMGSGFPCGLVKLADMNPSHPPKMNLNIASKVPENPQRLTLFKSRLNYGSLTAFAFDEACRWRFEHQMDEEARVLAQAVVHRFTIDSESLTVKFGNRCSLVLKAQNSPRIGKVISVLIGNTMKGDIVPPKNPASEKDEHVLLYHRLAAQAGNSGARPLVCSKARSDEVPTDLRFKGSLPWWSRAIDGANCPPAWWEYSEPT